MSRILELDLFYFLFTVRLNEVFKSELSISNNFFALAYLPHYEESTLCVLFVCSVAL